MSIPMEVIEDILSRLPVKPLLRFRCVSPPWRDMIDSSHFIKLHLSRSMEKETNLNLLLHDQMRKRCLYAAKFDPSILSVEAKEVDHHPLRDAKYGTPEVLGSCNGLICICYDSYDSDEIFALGAEFQTRIVIWNPSTRRSVTLPCTAFDCREEEFDGPISDYTGGGRAYVFGYDSVGDDYKVVMLLSLIKIDSARTHIIKVYSLNAHSWHPVEVSFHNLSYMKREPGQSAKNAFHWIMSLDEDNAVIIVAFDFRTETCRIVPNAGIIVPRLTDTRCIGLQHFRDSISLLYVNHLGLADVWVMGEYGVKESWTKLLTLEPKLTRLFYVPNKGGGVFMEHGDTLLWIDTGDGKTCYNLEAGTKHEKVKSIEVRGLRSFENPYTYNESLVPLGRFSKMIVEKKPTEKKNQDMAGFLSKGFKLKL